jgi:hypothetical protein
VLDTISRLITTGTGRRVSVALAAVGWGLATLGRVRDELADDLATNTEPVAATEPEPDGDPYVSGWLDLVGDLYDRIRFLRQTVKLVGFTGEDVLHEADNLDLLYQRMKQEMGNMVDHGIPVS